MRRFGSINRVILCSDGVANVGQTGPDAILREVRAHVEEGITLTTIGFGMGNFNDILMEQLANKGNGSYAYVDDSQRGKADFCGEFDRYAAGHRQRCQGSGRFQSSRVVSRFRLLGYENRRLDHEDFRDDNADGGEIGSGHSVTALYEIKLHEGAVGQLATVSIRHEDPDTRQVTEVSADIFATEVGSCV